MKTKRVILATTLGLFLCTAIWASPNRFTSGVTNVASDKTFGLFFEPSPTKVFRYYNDFITYAVTDWVATATSVGGGTSAAAMSDTETGGAIVITNAANEDDSYWLQLSHDGGTNDSETFKFATTKKAWFRARFQGNDVDQTDYVLGLHITAVDPIDTAPTDGIWFQSDDGDGNIDIHIVKDSVYTTASVIATLSDDTYVTVGYYWDGVNTLHYFVNDVELGTLSAGTLPDDETLALSFGAQNGEATANTMTIDYIGAWMER
jgi:hypothetical protein